MSRSPLFDDKDAWRAAKRPLWYQTADVAGGEVRVSRQLPPGRYAVMAYHDRNANGRLDTLPIGLPTEPYGFSNNSRGAFGPAAWSSAVFSLGEDGAQQVIRLR